MNAKRKYDARMILTLALVVVTIFMVSCGPTATDIPQPTTVGTPAATVAATQQPAPTAATAGLDTLVVAIDGSPETLDPQAGTGEGPGWNIREQLNAGLIRFKTKEVDGGLVIDSQSFEGNLAESWSLSDDGTTYVFRLRPGLKFANGDPIDAEALKYSFERPFEAGMFLGFACSLVGVPDKDHIRVVDDRTVEITMDPPNTALLNEFAQHTHGILNPRELEAGKTPDDPWALEWARTHNAGAGPFTVESWTTDEIVLVRNENFWDPPRLEKIVFKVVPDPATRLLLLREGAVDFALEIPLESLPDLETDPNLTVRAVPSTNVVMAAMDNKAQPFDDILVRQAMSYAIPYDTILENVYYGYASRLRGVVPEGMPTYDPTLPYYDYDPDKAKELLGQSSYPNGFETELFIASGLEYAQGVAVWIQSGLRDIGINAEITSLPVAEFRERSVPGGLPLSVQGWQTFANDPLFHMSWLFEHPCCNYAQFENQEVWNLIDQHLLTSDAEARDEASHLCQEVIMEEAPYLFIAQTDHVTVTRSNVKGVIAAPADGYQRFWAWYKE